MADLDVKWLMSLGNETQRQGRGDVMWAEARDMLPHALLLQEAERGVNQPCSPECIWWGNAFALFSAAQLRTNML